MARAHARPPGARRAAPRRCAACPTALPVPPSQRPSGCSPGPRRGPHAARHRPRRRPAARHGSAAWSIFFVSACEPDANRTPRYNPIPRGEQNAMTLNLTIMPQLHTDFSPRITVDRRRWRRHQRRRQHDRHEPSGRGVRGRQHRCAAASAFARGPAHPARAAHHAGARRRREAGDRPGRGRGSRRRAVSAPRRRAHGVHHRGHGRRHRHRRGAGDRAHGPRAQHPHRRRGDEAVHLRGQPPRPRRRAKASPSCSSSSIR